MIKNTGASFVGFEDNSSFRTVLARIEDAWQYGFLIEEVKEDQCVVYIPGRSKYNVRFCLYFRK